MSVCLDLPKYRCEECEYFCPMTTKTIRFNKAHFTVGCACKNLCDSTQRLEKELEKAKENENKYKLINKWTIVEGHTLPPLDSMKQNINDLIPKFYHLGCRKKVEGTKHIMYSEPYTYCPDCGEKMMVTVVNGKEEK